MPVARRTLLKTLPAGAVAPYLAPLVARAEAEAAGTKPMRFVFVLESNGMWPEFVMPAGFKRQEMPNPKGATGSHRNKVINGADTVIDLPLGGPDLPLVDGLAPLQKHIRRITLLTGMSNRVTQPGHTAGFGALGCYLGHQEPIDITIDAALAKTTPAMRPLLALGFNQTPGPNTTPMFTGLSAYGPSQKVSFIQDPVLAHTMLFGKVLAGDPLAHVGSQSILLDFLAERMRQTRPLLPGEEGRKIERAADAFATIGERQKRLGEVDPAKIPPLRPDFHGAQLATKRVEAHFEIATTALIAGLTNTVTLCLGQCIGGSAFADWTGLDLDHGTHDIGHMGPEASALASRLKVRRFISGQIATLVEALEAVPEGDGTMMDNTLIVSMSDHGEEHHATGMEWPMVLVGNLGGRLKAGGRFVNVAKYGAPGHATLAEFYMALLHAASAPVDHFGQKDASLSGAGLKQKEPWPLILA